MMGMSTMPNIDTAVFLSAVLLLLAVFAHKASTRMGVPGLLLFLGIGMLAGSDGPGGIYFDNAFQAQAVGIVALAFILFASGLELGWSSAKSVLAAGLSLATVGVVLTTLAAGTFARWLLGMTWLESLLLGAIVSSTDAAAVFSVLRSRSVILKGRIQPLIEFESGSNDPMAVFLTIGLIELMKNPGEQPLRLVPAFLMQMAAGSVAGFIAGKLTVLLLNRLKLEAEGLYPVLTIGVLLLTYGGCAIAGGSGFLAVYLAGIIIGNSDVIHKGSLIRFHDGVAWLMQIAMFLVLGLLVFPSRLPAVAAPGLLFSIFLIFVARPLGVGLSLALSKMPLREQALIAWAGLRGAAPIVLATFPKLAGLERADLYFNLVFFIVLTSVLLQGTTIPIVGRWLRLEDRTAPRIKYPLEFVPTTRSKSAMVDVEVPPGSPVAGRQIVELELPDSALIVLVSRGQDFLSPRGATVLHAGDSLLILADKDDWPAIRSVVNPDENVPGRS